MWYKLLFFLFAIGSTVGTFKGGRCRVHYQYVPKYVTQLQHVPHYKTVYNTKYIPSPVPEVVYQTEFVDKLVSEDFFQTIFTTVLQPQYIPVTKIETVYTTQAINQIIPQYVTKTVYQPKYITHTNYHKISVPVLEYVTKCSYDY